MAEKITSGTEQFHQNGYHKPSQEEFPEGFTPGQVEGTLPHGKKLKEPIQVLINCSDGEFVVNEPKFYNYATGESLEEALAEFKETLVASLESLTIEEPKLG